MQDKIQEIMGLVDALSVECIAFGIAKMASSSENKTILGDEVKKSRDLLQSKLRELVQEPLSADERKELIADMDSPEQLILSVERIHNITNTSGVE